VFSAEGCGSVALGVGFEKNDDVAGEVSCGSKGAGCESGEKSGDALVSVVFSGNVVDVLVTGLVGEAVLEAPLVSVPITRA